MTTVHQIHQDNQDLRTNPQRGHGTAGRRRSLGLTLVICLWVFGLGSPATLLGDVIDGQGSRSGEQAKQPQEAKTGESKSRTEEVAGQIAPDWFAEHVAYLVAGSGLWLADNAAYRSDQEPAEAYGILWRSGIGKTSATGELFGVSDGRRTHTHWELRVYWDPDRGEARLLQWGHGGMMLSARLEESSDGRYRAQGNLSRPGGPILRRAEEVHHVQPDVQTNRSLAWDAGRWIPEREYRWLRQSAAAASEVLGLTPAD